MDEFDVVWKMLQTSLKPGTVVRNWTAYRGYIGNTMTVSQVKKQSIDIDAPGADNIQSVPRSDFERVWEVWLDYKNEKVKRFELSPLTRYSKYIISLFHWLETEK